MSKKIEILEAAKVAIDELIKVLREPIITRSEDDISADKLKNAASAKRLAFEDALNMLQKIEEEENKSSESPTINVGNGGFAEGRAKKK
jgi:CHASE3 domain sensor protein